MPGKTLLKSLLLILILLPTFLAGTAAADRITDLERDIATNLNQIAADAGRPSPSLETLGRRIAALEGLVNDMEFNLEHNFTACRSAPAPPNGAAALQALRNLLKDPPDFGEKSAKEKCIETYTKQIAVLKKLKKRTQDVFKILSITRIGKAAKDIFDAVKDPKETLKKLVEKWAEDAKQKYKTGQTMPDGLSGDPLDLLDHPNITKLKGYEGSKNYIVNRKKNHGGTGLTFNEYCKRQWEQSYNRKFDPATFPGWYLDDILVWKQVYVLTHIDPDIQWLESKRNACGKKSLLERLRERIAKKIEDHNQKVSQLILGLEAALNKTRQWRRFEKWQSTIIVTVDDDATSTQLANAQVVLTPTVGNPVTSNNPFQYDEVPNGKYVVEARAPGYVTKTQGLTINQCNTHNINIRLERRPRIRITRIVHDDTNLPVTDPIALSVIDAQSRARVGTGTYQGGAVEFTVDAGSYEIRADDPTGNLELMGSRYVNVNPGDVRDIQLRMRPRSSFVFVIEVYDQRSGLLINPPVGASPVPRVSIEPQDGQSKPSGPAYQGGGQIHFDYVRLGQYRYKANFCGWQYKEGIFNVQAEDVSGQRVVKRLMLQPTFIDVYPIRVRERGDKLVHGFRVSVTGLGPRQGEPLSVITGEDPTDPNYIRDYTSFRIRGPFYSGRYRIKITHPCYTPFILDQWFVFCGNAPFAYKRQTLYLEPLPTYVEARVEARRAIELTRRLRSRHRTLEDEQQKLIQERALLKQAMADFKKTVAGQKLNREQRKQAEAKHSELKTRITKHEGKVRAFEQDRQAYNKKRQERERLIKKLQSYGSVLECLKLDTLLKDDLVLLKEESVLFSAKAGNVFKPPLALPPLGPDRAQVVRCEALIEKVRGFLPGDVVGALKLLEQEMGECSGLTSEIDERLAALAQEIEQRLQKQLGTLQSMLSACEFEKAKESIAKMPKGPNRSQAETAYREALQREEKAQSLLEAADALNLDCEYANALVKLEEAGTHASCNATRDQISQKSAEVRKAETHERLTQSLFKEANNAYKRCNYDFAISKLNEARDHTRCERYRERLGEMMGTAQDAKVYEETTKALFQEANDAYQRCDYDFALRRLGEARDRTGCKRYKQSLAEKINIVTKAADHEKQTLTLFEKAQNDFKNCDLDAASDKLDRALNHTNCETHRRTIEQMITRIKKGEQDVGKVKQLFAEAKSDYAQCNHDEALGKLEQALTHAPCGRYRESLAQKIATVKAAQSYETKTRSLFSEANSDYKRCDYAAALEKLNSALTHTRCERYQQSLRGKIDKVWNAQKDNDRATTLLREAQGLIDRGDRSAAVTQLEEAHRQARCNGTREKVEGKLAALKSAGSGGVKVQPEPPAPPQPPAPPPVSSGKWVGTVMADYWWICEKTPGKDTGSFNLDVKRDRTFTGTLMLLTIGTLDLSGKIDPSGNFTFKKKDGGSYIIIKGRLRPGSLPGYLGGRGEIHYRVVATESDTGKIVSSTLCKGEWKAD